MLPATDADDNNLPVTFQRFEGSCSTGFCDDQVDNSRITIYKDGLLGLPIGSGRRKIGIELLDIVDPVLPTDFTDTLYEISLSPQPSNCDANGKYPTSLNPSSVCMIVLRNVENLVTIIASTGQKDNLISSFHAAVESNPAGVTIKTSKNTDFDSAWASNLESPGTDALWEAYDINVNPSIDLNPNPSNLCYTFSYNDTTDSTLKVAKQHCGIQLKTDSSVSEEFEYSTWNLPTSGTSIRNDVTAIQFTVNKDDVVDSHSFPLAAVRFIKKSNASVDLELRRQDFAVTTESNKVTVNLTDTERNALNFGEIYIAEIDYGFVEAEINSCKQFIKKTSVTGFEFCFRRPDFAANLNSLRIFPDDSYVTFVFSNLPFDVTVNPSSTDHLTLSTDDTGQVSDTFNIEIPKENVTTVRDGDKVTVTASHPTINTIEDDSLRLFLVLPSKFFQRAGECGDTVFSADDKLQTCADDPITVTTPLSPSGNTLRSTYEDFNPSFNISFSNTITDFGDSGESAITITAAGESPTFTTTVNNGNVHVNFSSPTRGVNYTLTVGNNSVKTTVGDLCDPVAGHQGPDEDFEHFFCVYDPLTISVSPSVGANFEISESDYASNSSTFTIDGSYDIDTVPDSDKVHITGGTGSQNISLSTADMQDRDVLVYFPNPIFGTEYTLTIPQNSISTTSGTCGETVTAPSTNITHTFCVHKDDITPVENSLSLSLDADGTINGITFDFIEKETLNKNTSEVVSVSSSGGTVSTIENSNISISSNGNNRTVTVSFTLDNPDLKNNLDITLPSGMFYIDQCINVGNPVIPGTEFTDPWRVCYNVPFVGLNVSGETGNVDTNSYGSGTFTFVSSKGYPITDFNTDRDVVSITYSDGTVDQSSYSATITSNSLQVVFGANDLNKTVTYTININADGLISNTSATSCNNNDVIGPSENVTTTFCVYDLLDVDSVTPSPSGPNFEISESSYSGSFIIESNYNINIEPTELSITNANDRDYNVTLSSGNVTVTFISPTFGTTYTLNIPEDSLSTSSGTCGGETITGPQQNVTRSFCVYQDEIVPNNDSLTFNVDSDRNLTGVEFTFTEDQVVSILGTSANAVIVTDASNTVNLTVSDVSISDYDSMSGVSIVLTTTSINFAASNTLKYTLHVSLPSGSFKIVQCNQDVTNPQYPSSGNWEICYNRPFAEVDIDENDKGIQFTGEYDGEFNISSISSNAYTIGDFNSSKLAIKDSNGNALGLASSALLTDGDYCAEVSSGDIVINLPISRITKGTTYTIELDIDGAESIDSESCSTAVGEGVLGPVNKFEETFCVHDPLEISLNSPSLNSSVTKISQSDYNTASNKFVISATGPTDYSINKPPDTNVTITGASAGEYSVDVDNGNVEVTFSSPTQDTNYTLEIPVNGLTTTNGTCNSNEISGPSTQFSQTFCVFKDSISIVSAHIETNSTRVLVGVSIQYEEDKVVEKVSNDVSGVTVTDTTTDWDRSLNVNGKTESNTDNITEFTFETTLTQNGDGDVKYNLSIAISAETFKIVHCTDQDVFNVEETLTVCYNIPFNTVDIDDENKGVQFTSDYNEIFFITSDEGYNISRFTESDLSIEGSSTLSKVADPTVGAGYFADVVSNGILIVLPIGNIVKGINYTIELDVNGTESILAQSCSVTDGVFGPITKFTQTFCVHDRLEISLTSPSLNSTITKISESDYKGTSSQFVISPDDDSNGNDYDLDDPPDGNVTITNADSSEYNHTINPDGDLVVTFLNASLNTNYTLNIPVNGLQTTSGTCSSIAVNGPSTAFSQDFCVYKDSISTSSVFEQTNQTTRELSGIIIQFSEDQEVTKISDGVTITDTTSIPNRDLTVTPIPSPTYSAPTTEFIPIATLTQNSAGDVKYNLSVVITEGAFKIVHCTDEDVENEEETLYVCYNIPFDTVDIEDDDEGIQFTADYDGTFLINSTDGYNIDEFNSSKLAIKYGNANANSLTQASTSELADGEYFAEISNGDISINLPISNLTKGITYTIELDIDGANSTVDQSCSDTDGVFGPITKFEETFCVHDPLEISLDSPSLNSSVTTISQSAYDTASNKFVISATGPTDYEIDAPPATNVTISGADSNDYNITENGGNLDVTFVSPELDTEYTLNIPINGLTTSSSSACVSPFSGPSTAFSQVFCVYKDSISINADSKHIETDASTRELIGVSFQFNESKRVNEDSADIIITDTTSNMNLTINLLNSTFDSSSNITEFTAFTSLTPTTDVVKYEIDIVVTASSFKIVQCTNIDVFSTEVTLDVCYNRPFNTVDIEDNDKGIQITDNYDEVFNITSDDGYIISEFNASKLSITFGANNVDDGNYTATASNGIEINLPISNITKGTTYTIELDVDGAESTVDQSCSSNTDGVPGPITKFTQTFCVYDLFDRDDNLRPLNFDVGDRLVESSYRNVLIVDLNYKVDSIGTNPVQITPPASPFTVPEDDLSINSDGNLVVVFRDPVIATEYTMTLKANSTSTNTGTCESQSIDGPQQDRSIPFCVYQDNIVPNRGSLTFSDPGSALQLKFTFPKYSDTTLAATADMNVTLVKVGGGFTDSFGESDVLNITAGAGGETWEVFIDVQAEVVDTVGVLNDNGATNFHVIISPSSFAETQCRLNVTNALYPPAGDPSWSVCYNNQSLEDPMVTPASPINLTEYNGRLIAQFNQEIAGTVNNFDTNDDFFIIIRQLTDPPKINFVQDTLIVTFEKPIPGVDYHLDIGADSIKSSADCFPTITGPPANFTYPFCFFETPLIDADGTQPADLGQSNVGDIELCISITGIHENQTLLEGSVGQLDFAAVNDRDDVIGGKVPSTTLSFSDGNLTIDNDKRTVCGSINVEADKHYKVLVKDNFVKVDNCDIDYNSTEHFFTFCTHQLECEPKPKVISRSSSENLGQFLLVCNHKVIQAPGQTQVIFGSNRKHVTVRPAGKNVKITLKSDEPMSDLADSGFVRIPKGLLLYHLSDLCIVENKEINIPLDELEETNNVITATPAPLPVPQVPIDRNEASQQAGVISNEINPNNARNIQRDARIGSVTLINRIHSFGGISRTFHQDTNSGAQLPSANPVDGGRTLVIPSNEVSDESSPIVIGRNVAGGPRTNSNSGSSRGLPLVNQPDQRQLPQNRGLQQSFNIGRSFGSGLPSVVQNSRRIPLRRESIGDRTVQQRLLHAGRTLDNSPSRENLLRQYNPFKDRPRQRRYHELDPPMGRILKQSIDLRSPEILRRGQSGIPSKYSIFQRQRRDINTLSFVHPLVRAVRKSNKQFGKDATDESVE